MKPIPFLLGTFAATATTARAATDAPDNYTALLIPTNYSSLLPGIAPTPTPTTHDIWMCATQNVTQYFDVPRPTPGALSAALSSFRIGVLRQLCGPAMDGPDPLNCPLPDPPQLCAFSTAGPPSVLADYTSFRAAAASWWAAHRSAAYSLADMCPQHWSSAMLQGAGNAIWLNDTIILAGCAAEATGGAGSSAPTVTAAPGAGITATNGPEPTATATATKAPNGVIGRAEDAGMWVVVGTGIAAAAVNTIW